MQLKLYKRSTLLLLLVLVIDVLCIVAIVKNQAVWQANRLVNTILFILGIMLLSAGYSYYDLNTDKLIIRKRVKNGDVAMAKIISGKFVRFGRDAKLKNHVYWQLNVEIYDNDMTKINATIIEKFSTHQTKIPKGYVFVTYLEGKENDSLIVPNVIISSIDAYEPLVKDYEKALKPTYLNAYYNNGLIVQSYEDSIKAQKDYQKWCDEIDSKVIEENPTKK